MAFTPVIVFVFIAVFGKCNSYIYLDFCSGSTITDNIGTNDTALIVNGSPDHVRNYVSGSFPVTCTCSITPFASEVEKYTVRLKTYTESDVDTCNKEIDVIIGSITQGHAVKTFRCDSDEIDVPAADTGGEMHLVFHMQDGGQADDQYNVLIETEPTSKLSVTCSKASLPFSTTTETLGDTGSDISNAPPTAIPSTTTEGERSTRKIIQSGSNDTGLIVGVVVGLGLLFLVVITCLLCYIARRKRRHDLEDKTETQQESQRHGPTQGVSSQNRLRRTLTQFYTRLKINRPLPKIPGSSTMAKKAVQSLDSGHYASIRSNANSSVKQHASKQVSIESVQSNDTYMEPVATATVNETETETKYNGRQSPLKDTSALTKEDSVDYLHPETSATTSDTMANKLNSIHSACPMKSKKASVELTDKYICPSVDTGKENINVNWVVHEPKSTAISTETTDLGKTSSTHPVANTDNINLSEAITSINKHHNQYDLDPTDSHKHPKENEHKTDGDENKSKLVFPGTVEEELVESADSYICPVDFVDKRETDIGNTKYVNLANDYINPADFQKTIHSDRNDGVYTNVADSVFTEDYLNHDAIQRLKPNSENEPVDSTATLVVETNSETNKLSAPDASVASITLVKPKSPVTETDSGGYVKMTPKKPLLKTEDSLFPNLFHFTPHANNIASPKSPEIEDSYTEKSNQKKQKRYVR